MYQRKTHTNMRIQPTKRGNWSFSQLGRPLKFTHLKWFLCKYSSGEKCSSWIKSKTHLVKNQFPWSSPHPHRQPTLHSLYPTAHSPEPLINIHFFIFMLQKKAVMGKKEEHPQQKPHTCTSKHGNTLKEFTNDHITTVNPYMDHLMENK